MYLWYVQINHGYSLESGYGGERREHVGHVASAAEEGETSEPLRVLVPVLYSTGNKQSDEYCVAIGLFIGMGTLSMSSV